MSEKNHKCPCCDGKGSYYLEGNLDRNGGIVACHICDQKGWLTEEEQAEVEKLREEYNEYIQGDPPRAGIFSKKLKSD